MSNPDAKVVETFELQLAWNRATDSQLELLSKKADIIAALLDEQVAELRDELLALSNRLEALTRATCSSGLHSVRVDP